MKREASPWDNSCSPSQGYTHSVLLNFLLRQERAVFQDIPKSTDFCCDRVLPQSCNKTQGEREYVFMWCVKFSKLLWEICERARDKLGLSFFFSIRSVWCRLWACLQIVLAAWRRRISKPTSQTCLACFWKCWILECNTPRKYEFQIYFLFYMMKVY